MTTNTYKRKHEELLNERCFSLTIEMKEREVCGKNSKTAERVYFNKYETRRIRFITIRIVIIINYNYINNKHRDFEIIYRENSPIM